MDILFGIIIGMCMAIVISYASWRKGIEEGYTEGYVKGAARGYEEGYEDSIQDEVETEVPKTGDGKFYSTMAAMRSIGKVGDE